LLKPLFVVTGDIGRLTRALTFHGETSTAKTIQIDFGNLLNDIFSHESKIWMESTSGDDQDPDHRFGPEATTADIILQKQEPKLVIPTYHLLGKIKLRALEVLFIIPLLSFLVMTFNNLTCDQP
jgi:hypothetical protein